MPDDKTDDPFDMFDFPDFSSDDCSSKPPASARKSAEADPGALSQSEIDALLAGEPFAEPEKKPATSDPGALSQDEIDELLGGAPRAKPEPVAPKPGSGELSQAEIDELLGGSPTSAPDADRADASVDPLDAIELPRPGVEVLSQAEIDDLLAAIAAGEAMERAEAEVPAGADDANRAPLFPKDLYDDVPFPIALRFSGPSGAGWGAEAPALDAAPRLAAFRGRRGEVVIGGRVLGRARLLADASGLYAELDDLPTDFAELAEAGAIARVDAYAGTVQAPDGGRRTPEHGEFLPLIGSDVAFDFAVNGRVLFRGDADPASGRFRVAALAERAAPGDEARSPTLRVRAASFDVPVRTLLRIGEGRLRAFGPDAREPLVDLFDGETRVTGGCFATEDGVAGIRALDGPKAEEELRIRREAPAGHPRRFSPRRVSPRPGGDDPFAPFGPGEADAIARILRYDDPRVASLVLGALAPETAKLVFARLHPSNRTVALEALLESGTPTPGAVSFVASSLRERLGHPAVEATGGIAGAEDRECGRAGFRSNLSQALAAVSDAEPTVEYLSSGISAEGDGLRSFDAYPYGDRVLVAPPRDLAGFLLGAGGIDERRLTAAPGTIALALEDAVVEAVTDALRAAVDATGIACLDEARADSGASAASCRSACGMRVGLAWGGRKDSWYVALPPYLSLRLEAADTPSATNARAPGAMQAHDVEGGPRAGLGARSRCRTVFGFSCGATSVRESAASGGKAVIRLEDRAADTVGFLPEGRPDGGAA